MRRDKRMRHITRVDYARRNQHGWWVRIHRDGKMIQKFFSDWRYGGESSALHEAKRHRGALLILYPKPERGNMFNKTSSRNTSGIVGVNKTLSRSKGHVYEVWQAAWMLPGSKHVNRKFHFSADGRSEEEARELAIKAREDGLKTIKRMSADKNEKRRARKAKAAKKVKAVKSRKKV